MKYKTKPSDTKVIVENTDGGEVVTFIPPADKRLEVEIVVELDKGGTIELMSEHGFSGTIEYEVIEDD